LELTEEEAADVAAECVAAIEWQVSNIITNPNSDDIGTSDMIAALTPRYAATLRTIEAMKRGDGYQTMKEVAHPGSADFRVVLMAATCRSIAGTLAMWGFGHHADRIAAALDRGDIAATGH